MPITNLQDKKCLITGAGSGIGLALAHAADREGATLLLTDINAAALDETVAALRNQGVNVQFSFPTDIADHAVVAEMAATLHAEHEPSKPDWCKPCKSAASKKAIPASLP